jgi:hypothetical protein
MHPRSSHSLVTAVAATVFAQACSTGRTADEPRAALIPAPEVGAAAPAERSPEGLARLLDAHDGATGAEKARLAAQVDEVAAQRYATVSRLFWYTDLDEARAAARASGKPILSLRMLGRLDEDWSCANSRFFRVALYANAELSRWLRDTFVLHWSSERPVPKLTIDFGDGRRIATTMAGNSAHYVLDADGRVLDVLPGLMTPRAFRDELEAVVELAGRLDGTSAGDRARLLEEHHAGRVEAIDRTWKKLGAAQIPAGTFEVSLAAAQRRTVSKAFVEMPVVKTAQLGPDPSSIPADSDLWEQIGIRLLAERGLETEAPAAAAFLADELDARILPAPVVLDAQSRALVETLAPVDWTDAEHGALDEPERAALIRRFEGAIVADTALDTLQLRRIVHAQLAGLARAELPMRFADVNAWVYGTLFLTPAADPWLGMATPGVFTGLPRDGVVEPR